MKRSLTTVLAAGLLLAMIVAAGCNTTKGAGKDIQKTGDAIQNSADRHGAN